MNFITKKSLSRRTALKGVGATFALPLLDGSVQVTFACLSPDVAVIPVGASGRAAGVTELDEADTGPVPTEFVPDTVNV